MERSLIITAKILSLFLSVLPMNADVVFTGFVNESSLPLEILEVRQSAEGLTAYYFWNDGLSIFGDRWGNSNNIPIDVPRIFLRKLKGFDPRILSFRDWVIPDDELLLRSKIPSERMNSSSYPEEFRIGILNDWIENLYFGWLFIPHYPWIWFPQMSSWGYVLESQIERDGPYSSYWVYSSQYGWCIFSEIYDYFFVLDQQQWVEFQ